MGFKDAGKRHYLGHRERLRRRFREAGADALPDYELLEMILFRAVPRPSPWPRPSLPFRKLHRGAERA